MGWTHWYFVTKIVLTYCEKKCSKAVTKREGPKNFLAAPKMASFKVRWAKFLVLPFALRKFQPRIPPKMFHTESSSQKLSPKKSPPKNASKNLPQKKILPKNYSKTSLKKNPLKKFQKKIPKKFQKIPPKNPKKLSSISQEILKILKIFNSLHHTWRPKTLSALFTTSSWERRQHFRCS